MVMSMIDVGASAANIYDRPAAIGLSQTDRSNLEFYFRDYEAAIGQRSMQGGFAESCWGVSGGGTEDADGRMASIVDSGVTKKAGHVYRALRAMEDAGQSRELVVLFRLYGPRNPLAEHGCFGDVAPIVDMTQAVEECREEDACFLGEERESGVMLKLCDDAVEEEFWRSAGIVTRLEAKIARREAPMWDAPAEEKVAFAVASKELARRLAGWRKFLGSLIDRYDLQPELAQLPARLSALASGDKETTHADALRERLDGKREKDGVRRPPAVKTERLAWESDRRSFVATVRKEAEQLRARAGHAYVTAKRNAVKPTSIVTTGPAMRRYDDERWCLECEGSSRHHGPHSVRERGL